MDILGNIFVKKAIQSMMTEEQFKMMERLMTAVQSGKINQEKLKRVGYKFSKLSVDEINGLLDLIDKNI
jgi:hypothetical protein